MSTTSMKSFAPRARLLLQEPLNCELDYVLTANTVDLRESAAEVECLRKKAECDL